MRINGTPQHRRYKALGGKKPGGKNWAKKMSSGGKGRSGCLPALVTIAILGTGWASMLLTGGGWVS